MFLSGVNIIFLSLVQVSAGVLQGLGKPNEPVKALLVGCVLKIAFDVALILIKPLNIFGAVLSAGGCYFAVLLLNQNKVYKLTGAKIFSDYFHISIQVCFVSLFAFGANILFKMVFSETIALFIAGIIAVIVFLVTYYSFFIQSNGDSDESSFSQIT